MKKTGIVLLAFVIVWLFSACEQSKTSSDVNFDVSQNEASVSQTMDYPETSQTEDYVTDNSESAVTSQFTQKDTSSRQANQSSQANQSGQSNQSGQIEKPTQSSKPIGSNNSTSDNNDHDETSVEELVGINKLRVDYNLGTCRNLSGNVSVILFYMDGFESSWTADEITNFTNNEVKPGLAFLEKEARSYGVELNFSIKQSYSSVFYDDEVIISIKETGLATIDVLSQAAHGLNYSSDEEMIADFKSQYGTEIVCFTIFNKNGTAYAINPHRGQAMQIQEHCIIFAYDLNSNRNDPIGSQSSIVAHEMLHLFGAEDFYATANRKTLAKKHYPADIMLGANYYIITNNIGDATAFYIGWTDKVPDVLYHENW